MASRQREGLRSETLQAALAEALAGRTAALERLFSDLGDALLPRPNLKLAAAFGVEMQALPGPAAKLLSRLSGDDAAPDTARVFLPIAAAHGWAGRVRAGREVELGWAALGELAADERAPVRVGALDALVDLGARPGGADELVARATAWLDDDDRERRYGTAALATEALGDRRVLAVVRDQEALRAYLGRGMDEIASSPRSAERSDARRRLLVALPRTLAAVMGTAAGGIEGQDWLRQACEEARHEDLRGVLAETLVRLRAPAHGRNAALVEILQRALEGSAKPLRDPTRVRPGTGRGKASRRVR